MRHGDPLFLDPRAGPAGPVDAVEHHLLAHRAGQRLGRALALGPLFLLLVLPLRLVALHLVALGLVPLGLVVRAQGLLHPARAAGGHDVLASFTLVRVRRP